MLRKLRIWTNEVDYVIAESLEQARFLTAQHYMGDNQELWNEWFNEDEMTWEFLSPDSDFTFYEEDRATVKTVAEWLDIYSSPRYFACGDI